MLTLQPQLSTPACIYSSSLINSHSYTPLIITTSHYRSHGLQRLDFSIKPHRLPIQQSRPTDAGPQTLSYPRYTLRHLHRTAQRHNTYARPHRQNQRLSQPHVRGPVSLETHQLWTRSREEVSNVPRSVVRSISSRASEN